MRPHPKPSLSPEHQQQHDRLKARLGELSSWRDLYSAPLSAAFKQGKEWLELAPGQPWPHREFPVQIILEGEVPASWAGCAVWTRLNVGGEALLSVDGRVLGGLNPFHREHPLMEQAKGGEVIALEVEAVPRGLFGQPNPGPRLEEAVLIVPDLQVRDLLMDLTCAWEAVPQVHPDVAQLLLDLLSRTVALLELPRSPARPYLEQLERSEWSAMTATLWEEWKFAGHGIPLSEAHRASLERAKTCLMRGLAEIAGRYPSVGQVWATGHAHIDLAWLWPVAETRRKIRRTFASVLRLMEQYPDLHFNQSSAQAYAWIEHDDPEVFEGIRARVAEGRWELVGGMWVEPDGNLLSGESWARQLLYGQGYFKAKFGKRCSVAWLPDTFGFAANLPQILSKGDLPYFFTTKMNWNETNPFPHDLWQWEGLDGSVVLAHGFWNPNESYNGSLQATDLAGTWQSFRGKRYHQASLLAVGHGDGGGGPSAAMMERLERYRAFPGLPVARMGRVDAFYEQVAGSGEAEHGLWKPDDGGGSPLVSASRLPVWSGEMYLELHRATYTTQAEVKRLHRRLEQALVEAETAWSLLGLHSKEAHLGIDGHYPKAEIETYWKTLLLNQFHDILPGSGVSSVPQDAVEGMTKALAAVELIREEALGMLSSAIDRILPEAQAHLVIWNLSGRARPLRGRFRRPSQQFFRLMDKHGEEVPFQEAGEEILISTPAMVPAFGYLTLAMVTKLEGRKPVPSSLTASESVLENHHLRVEMAPDGSLARVYDKVRQREVLAGRGNQIWAYTDLPRFWEAWDLDASYTAEGQEVLATQVRRVDQGPLRAGIWVERRIGSSVIEQVYWLWEGSSRLEVETTAHWEERRTLLRALFPLAVRSSQATFETAFGAVQRPTHSNTSWDAVQFEVPALRWADLSEAGYGVSLLNDSKYGHSARGNVLGLSLLRGGLWPDPFADVGTHRFTYALYPHQGDWRGQTVEEAEDLNAPLRAVSLPANGRKDSSSQTLLNLCDLGSLRVSALKKAEDGRGYILRLYEAEGGRGRMRLDVSGLGIRVVSRVNLLEDNAEAMLPEKGVVTVEYTPFEVIGLRLEQ